MHEAKSLSDVYSFDKSYVTGLASGVNSSGFLLRFAPRGFETWIRLTEAFNQLCRGKKKNYDNNKTYVPVSELEIQ